LAASKIRAAGDGAKGLAGGGLGEKVRKALRSEE